MKEKRREKRISLGLVGLVLVILMVGCGTAVYQRTIKAIKPENFPDLISVIDSERCGEILFKPIHQGISISTYDCYITEAQFYDVAIFYVADGYASPGRLFRYQSNDFPMRSSLTHKVHINSREQPPMQVRVTTLYTMQLPKLQQVQRDGLFRIQRSQWDGDYPPP
ncbi:MAG: hypothetical protein AAF490_22115 [Chloroflexota bacterium]